jgi:transcriptional regulator with XRE-family HTH domain
MRLGTSEVYAWANTCKTPSSSHAALRGPAKGGRVGGTSQAELYDSFGAYVRSQRELAQLTLRQAAELARISNPYLSQIEHGVALPSIGVISALADALSVSTETLLLHAAGVVSTRSPERASTTENAIRHDPRLDEGQKHALLAVLRSFVRPTANAATANSRRRTT